MKIKLDENLGQRGAELFRAAGHDVATVPGQGLCSASDRELIMACKAEKRCLVSLDLDFANPLVFDPAAYAGIAVLRLPATQTPQDLYALTDALIAELVVAPIIGRLWIVEHGRIRQYQPPNEGPP